MSTPVEIDTQLAEIYGRLSTYQAAARNLRQQADRVRKYDDRQAVSLEARATVIELEADTVRQEMLPLEAQYTGWPRAFVVPEGHVHSSMACSTCRPTTEFGWVTELSGSTEAEIIEAAGSRACTVCYPSAPVDAAPGRIFHETEKAAEAARQERAAKKAAADAKKAEKAIGPYRAKGHGKIETVYAAKMYLTDGFAWGWGHPSFDAEDRDAIAALLAEKFGTTVREQLDAAEKRAANR